MLRFLLIFIMIAFVGCSRPYKIVVIPQKNKQYRSFASITEGIKKHLKEKIRIVHNDGLKLVVQVGNFEEDNLSATLHFGEKLVSRSPHFASGDFLEIPIYDTGMFTIKVYRRVQVRDFFGVQEIWKQKFFVQSIDDFTLSKDQIGRIADYYSPVVLMHDREKFFPSSLEYIFNRKLPSKKLSDEKFKISLPFSQKSFSFNFSDIEDILAGFGSSDAVIDIGNIHKLSSHIRSRIGNEKDNTIYYCYFEKDGLLYIRYYFLYSFDPKTSPYNIFSTHIFDRESFTLVYNIDEEQPEYMVYSSHLLHQTMGVGDENKSNYKKWKGGRLYLNWDEVPKVDEHPIVSIAEGSHAVFPFPGNYGVFYLGIPSLQEEAGGKKVLIPSDLSSRSPKNLRLYPYELRDLEIGSITSSSWNRGLAFSGNLIDFFSVPFFTDNLYFPPFTERDEHIYDYASKDNTHHFNVEDLSPSSHKLIKEVKEVLSN